MDLWVRSQNKCSLIKVNNIYLNDSNDCESINTDLGEYGIVEIGRYKTKKRALEVLNEIHQRLLNLQYLDVKGADYIPLKMKEDGIDVVYIMPEK